MSVGGNPMSRDASGNSAASANKDNMRSVVGNQRSKGKSARNKSAPNDMSSVRSTLEQLTQTQFAFLLDRGFSLPLIDRETLWTTYGYANTTNQLGLEIHLDFRDEAIDATLVRLQEDGSLPAPGFPVVNGQCRRIALSLLLRDHLHWQDESLTRLFALYQSDETAVVAMEIVQTLSEVVKRSLDLILKQPLDVIFPSQGNERHPSE